MPAPSFHNLLLTPPPSLSPTPAQEPPWQNAERARLKASIERLSKAEKELKRGGLHAALVGRGEAKGAPVPARAHTVAHKNKK